MWLEIVPKVCVFTNTNYAPNSWLHLIHDFVSLVIMGVKKHEEYWFYIENNYGRASFGE